MNKILWFYLILLTGTSFAQYREIPEATKTRLKSGLILGFINPDNFYLNHSIGISYFNINNASVSLTSYTATVGYKINAKMNISADITMQYSPYASVGSFNQSLNRDFQKSLTGIIISRVSFNYKPFKNLFINIDYFNNRNAFFKNDLRFFPYDPFWNMNY